MRAVRLAAIGIVACLALIACTSSDPPSPGPSTTSSIPGAPEESPMPSPSDLGFCVDRVVISEAFRMLRAGTVSYRYAAEYVTAASKVIRADADSASTALGAKKLRQFALYLNTLRLAILGSAENYVEDFAVRQFTSGLAARLRDISGELDCPA
jgi:hypothetical protein